ncbi:MraY family glycosyltransferase [Aporhodopirellula aestuarii]|uniref:Undecaprenyl/decaprenyl-phosphate alpha-N-acetylglucosaminyl 1-phosphate transferase n=1 Tax=Aporhodopirellula aestuarii TaxID=2950107 RepID=A0ABT0TX71_9BACT|nr:MraY family glycosyltransferase [Aporhodopirellula aestuarii]MCM2369202.1 undecaprenyl/decaprenyl-phosphate alpha-N-acetylglucosaminyl 1-phosphate transferase [Aporhodopirellula aestuarii]
MSATVLLVLAAAGTAMLISGLVLFPVRHYARQLGLLDRPGGHSSHTVPTPLGGGIGIYVGIVATIIPGLVAAWWMQVPERGESLRAMFGGLLPENFWNAAITHAPGVWSRSNDMIWLLLASTVLLILGLWDDRRGLSVIVRLGCQFGIAAAVVFGLGIELTAYLNAGWLTKSLSVIWIVAVINSFNMLDNMDALSGGIAAIIAISMAVVMLTTTDPGTNHPQLLVAGLLLVVAGALLGFLFHNRPPANIFMGDGGSYLVGFLIAVSMLMATFVGGPSVDGTIRPHAVLAPLCVMAVPLYDMATVLWIRVREGRSPFQGDHSHLSHRLVDLGLSRTAAVSTIHLITATCGWSAILLAHVGSLQAVTVLGIVGCMLTLVAILESTRGRGAKK